MTICHTFGPRMLRVLLRKRKKRQLYSININSHDSNFIVCVILPQDKQGVSLNYNNFNLDYQS